MVRGIVCFLWSCILLGCTRAQFQWPFPHWRINGDLAGGFRNHVFEPQTKARIASCHTGYFGASCKQKCRYPTYGDQCSQKCDCSERLCNHINGCPNPAIACRTGYVGKYCETPCRYPSYGAGCQGQCLCPEQQCNSSTGCRKMKNNNVGHFHQKLQLTPNSPITSGKKSLTKEMVTADSLILHSDSRIFTQITVTDEGCPVGYHGKDCVKQCRYPSYGSGCQYECFCSKPLCSPSYGCQKDSDGHSWGTDTQLETTIERTTASLKNVTSHEKLPMAVESDVLKKD